jgi:hypothetical protein
MNQCGDMKHDNPLDPENKDTHGKVVIRIDDPVEGDSVGMTYTVKGSVRPKAEIRVLTRALTSNQYWVEDVPVVDTYGEWRVVCWFGDEDVGMGEHYLILAITPKKNLLLEEVYNSIPEYTNMSNVVTVYRPE